MVLTPKDIKDIMSSLDVEQARKLQVVLNAFKDALDGISPGELMDLTGLTMDRCGEISFIWDAVVIAAIVQ
jgi:hypothetical protein